MLKTVKFSANSNLLLVLSSDEEEASDPMSIVAVWDFLDEQCECLCRSQMPFLIEDARWNLCLKNLEFVTITQTSYLFWRISDELLLQYQEGAKQFLVDETVPEADRPRAIAITDGVRFTALSETF